MNSHQNSHDNQGQSHFRVLWEDADLLAVEKPVGWLVDSGGDKADLVSSVGGGVFAFHRLDRETSGIVLLGKTRRYARDVTKLFEEKRIRKAYMAVVDGEWSLSRVETPIEGRTAMTTFRRLALGTCVGRPASWIEALPKTGRTHQIRIHCAESGHAILGDAKYGAANAESTASSVTGESGPLGHALHAYRLDFRHPATGEVIALRAPPNAWRESWLKDFAIAPLWAKMFTGDV